MMPQLHAHVDGASTAFAENRAGLLAMINDWRQREAQLMASEELAAPKFARRGQLLPRQRLALLLDRGAPFLELSSLAGFLMHDDKEGCSAGGGLISGIGYIAGVRCIVTASNCAVKGGSISPMGLEKSRRAQSIAMENKLPMVNLIESGGANLSYQAELFIKGGSGFAAQARLSAAGIPQITVVHGSCTAGGAYIPGLSDYVVMVAGKARVFLAGPPLLKAATGEIAEEESLGGAEMHACHAGTAEFLAENDREAILKAREIMDSLGWNATNHGSDRSPSELPLFPIDTLLGIVPPDFARSYDVRLVIARLADGSRFSEFKQAYDTFTVCGRACIDGHPVGLIGNNGPITTKGAVKAAQFIQLCCQTRTPLIYLQNTTGFMVGSEAEQGGIVKHGSKMIQAVACASVPQLTVVLGGSFGAGNYGMCGRGMGPRFIFSWPSARVGVMGSRQAAQVMCSITRAKWVRKGGPVDDQALAAMEQEIRARMDKESSALFATARLWDDGIIDPRDTRRVLAFCLDICNESENRQLVASSFGVARM